jgi:ABC-type multidrug transport system ATPase subunit
MSLEVVDLRVDYAEFSLGPVDLTLEPGRLLALLGTNGSGKSTLLRSILGLQSTAAGGVFWKDHSLLPRSARTAPTIGYVSDSSRDLLPEFTALEYWRYCLLAFEKARGRRMPEALDAAVRLSGDLDFPYGTRVPLAGLSLGTARKAQIIAALMTSPELVIMDEPFIGLDFIAARALEAVLLRLRAEGAALIVSNHDLDLASRLADSIVLLHRGRQLIGESVAALGGHARLESAIVAALEHAHRASG